MLCCSGPPGTDSSELNVRLLETCEFTKALFIMLTVEAWCIVLRLTTGHVRTFHGGLDMHMRH